MRRLHGMIALVLGAAALAGCQEKAPVYEDTRHLERPPPQPPHCPDDLPELKNVTLKDGSVVDVRIVQFGETKMYFPADLVDSEFVDQRRNMGMFISARDLRQFDPDIYLKECPGLVHELVEDSESLWPVIMIYMQKVTFKRSPKKNIKYSRDIAGIIITVHLDPAPSRKNMMAGSWNDTFVWDDKLFLMIYTPEENRGRWQHSKSLNEFLVWLATPPAQRDNDAVFTLKVDEK